MPIILWGNGNENHKSKFPALKECMIKEKVAMRTNNINTVREDKYWCSGDME